MEDTKDIFLQNELQKANISQNFASDGDTEIMTDEEFTKKYGDKGYFTQDNINKYFQDTMDFAKGLDANERKQYLEKAQLDVSNLRKKVVMVTSSRGVQYQTTRWVRTDTPEQHNTEQSIQKVINAPGPMAKKLRDLVKLGIFDRNDLKNLTGATTIQIYDGLRQVGVTKEMEEQLKKVTSSPIGVASEKGNATTFDNRNLLLTEISVDTRWNAYHNFLKWIVGGLRNGGVFYGLGGLGKSFGWETTLDKAEKIRYDEELAPKKEEYDYVVFEHGRFSPTELFKTMIDHNGKLIILDDISGLFDFGSTSIDIIKGATETKRDRWITFKGMNIKGYGGDPEANYPKTIRFTGQLIIIQNMAKELVPQPIIQSRVLQADLTMTKEQTLKKMNDIKYEMKLFGSDGELIDGEMKDNKLVGIDKDARDDATKFLESYKDVLELGIISPRTMGHLVVIHKEIWKDKSIADKDKGKQFIELSRIQTNAY